MPKQISNQVALSAIAKQVGVGLVELVDFLKTEGLASPADTVGSLSLLQPAQANAIKVKYSKGFTPTEPVKEKAMAHSVTIPKPETTPGTQTVEQLAKVWAVKPGELVRIVNIVSLACGLQFNGRIDDDWLALLNHARSRLNVPGGTGDKSPEQFINEMRAQLAPMDSAIAANVEAATAEDDSFMVDTLGAYLGEVGTDNGFEHQSVIEGWTQVQADNLRQLYDQSRLKRVIAMKFAYQLAEDSKRLQERNASQASLPWTERVAALAGTAKRTAAIALAPVNSNGRNAAAIMQAISASNRP